MQIEIYTKSSELPALIEGDIHHSAQMFGLLEKSRSSKPYMLVAQENGRELAHLIIIKRRGVRLLPPVAGFWYTIYGEGVYNAECNGREEVFALFLEKVFDMFGLHHNYIEIKNIEDPRFAYKLLSEHNFVPIRDCRLYISLHSRHPAERLCRKHRSHIRKATGRGAVCAPATAAAEIDEGLRLLRNYYRSKIHRPMAETRIIRGLLIDDSGELTANARLFTVKLKGKIIGCSVCLYSGDRALLAYSCGLRKSYPLYYPGLLSVWAAIEDAHKRGYAHIEFLESRTLTGIRSGYRNLLLNFGCKQVSTLRWYHFRWNIFNKILRAIYV